MNAKEQLAEIINVAACILKIPREELRSRSRLREFVYARHIICHLAVREFHLSLSLKQIGISLGGRDHSTVIHAVQTANDLLDFDSDFKTAYAAVRQNCNIPQQNHHASDYINCKYCWS